MRNGSKHQNFMPRAQEINQQSRFNINHQPRTYNHQEFNPYPQDQANQLGGYPNESHYHQNPKPPTNGGQALYMQQYAPTHDTSYMNNGTYYDRYNYNYNTMPYCHIN